MSKNRLRKAHLYFCQGKICCCCQFRGSGSKRLQIISQDPDPAKSLSKIVLKSLRKSENIRTIYIFKNVIFWFIFLFKFFKLDFIFRYRSVLCIVYPDPSMWNVPFRIRNTGCCHRFACSCTLYIVQYSDPWCPLPSIE